MALDRISYPSLGDHEPPCCSRDIAIFQFKGFDYEFFFEAEDLGVETCFGLCARRGCRLEAWGQMVGVDYPIDRKNRCT